MSSAMTGGYLPNSPISRTLVCRRPNSRGAAAETAERVLHTHPAARTLQQRRRVGRPRRAHGETAR